MHAKTQFTSKDVDTKHSYIPLKQDTLNHFSSKENL